MTYKELREELDNFNKDQLSADVVLYEPMKFKSLELVKWPMGAPADGEPTVMIPLFILKEDDDVK